MIAYMIVNSKKPKSNQIKRHMFRRNKKAWYADFWQNEVATHHSGRSQQTMPKKIVQLNEKASKKRFGELV